MNQASFFALGPQKKLRKAKFLEEMEVVLPWAELVDIVTPYYEVKKMGRPKTDLLLLLKTYFLQQWYNLSDPGVEEEIYDSNVFRQFLEIDLMDRIPDESVICRFRHLLEDNDLQKKMFNETNKIFEAKGLLLKRGTIVDATIIHASGSTKNQDKKRDPEMSSTKKGANYHFGMKTHIGCDAESGIVHSMTGTTAKNSDMSQMDELLHGEEVLVSGDKGYFSDEKKRAFRAKGKIWAVLDKCKAGKKKKGLSTKQKKRNKNFSRIRAKVEHPFGVIKSKWGHRRVRYRGLLKNTCHWYGLMMLANFYRVRQKLISVPL